MPLSYDLITFQILGQKFVKSFVGFLESLKNQKDILRLTDLQLDLEVTTEHSPGKKREKKIGYFYHEDFATLDFTWYKMGNISEDRFEFL